MTFKTDLYLPVEVSYKLHKGSKGARDSLCGIRGAGPPLEPDTDPEIEILDVFYNNKSILEYLSQKDLDLLLEELWNNPPDID